MAQTEQTIKDRIYFLTTKNPPVLEYLHSRHKAQSPLQYYDEAKNQLRALRYATNSSSVFVDEQAKEDIILGFIAFKNGKLEVPKTNPTLQYLLSIHPHRGVLFDEHNPEQQAEEELNLLEKEAEAIATAFKLNALELESIYTAIYGATNKKISEIKRDVLMFAKEDPATFLHLAADDLTKIKSLAIKSVDLGIVTLKDSVFYHDSTVLCRVPFDSEPNEVLSRWLHTSKEGKKFQQFLEAKFA